MTPVGKREFSADSLESLLVSRLYSMSHPWVRFYDYVRSSLVFFVVGLRYHKRTYTRVKLVKMCPSEFSFFDSVPWRSFGAHFGLRWSLQR